MSWFVSWTSCHLTLEHISTRVKLRILSKADRTTGGVGSLKHSRSGKYFLGTLKVLDKEDLLNLVGSLRGHTTNTQIKGTR